ncbi:CRISPR system Cascade subunit CasD [Methylobacterium sp. 174MFSha1.1]|uniref:type I-E CRISPR-associated protein Cas5/CasD n=1 Tax=Methylobacterium sp. 174MFSha1.1 TaxID=1502749 RepID=UPI0008F02EFE|nr:type I-E CRISPR-associated protein Cas5/CasD [Methylobacterium sp. 174MFSha1.1]SFU39460.1 CRISPR system Cascade subunit CasD [Methylobacterium sp. 174MFSha1.1]
MPAGLAFTLYAPLAALGDLAVGERRGGFDRPGRSAVLGLVAAALGYDRADEAGHAALDAGYGLVQRVRRTGRLMTDYHTVQAPPAERKSAWATRRAALDRPSHRLNTLLSSRDYREDLWVEVGLVQLRSVGPAPAEIAEALRRPAYTLYLGRKSCPLGRPPAPSCLDAVTSLAALLDRADEPVRLIADAGSYPFEPLRLWEEWDEAVVYADAELEGLLAPDYKADRIERRRDRVTSRVRRQFGLRDEIVATRIPRPEPEAAR